MNHLELFSGTHSFGKVSSSLGYKVYSLDRDLGAVNDGYTSQNHIKEDIMTWNYKVYPIGFFKLITASPVCLWWSILRNTHIGRILKGMDRPLTKEDLNNDIIKFGIPMIDKVFEIIDYFNPMYFIIENPKTGQMKDYINDLIPYYDIDYCKYTDWGYKKTTRFWTNIEGLVFPPCKNDCDNMITIEGQKLHKDRMGTSKTVLDNGKIIRVNTASLREQYKLYPNLQSGKKNQTKLDRYRIPPAIIHLLLE